MIELNELAEKHQVKFGTSGIRGVNSQLTDRVCYIYTTAFLQYLENFAELKPKQSIIIAGDLRENTNHILQVIYQAIVEKGYEVKYCGKIPTPALCYFCLQENAPGIMVTGSHIPENMNGIKFYKADGEILKKDEQSILALSIVVNEELFSQDSRLKEVKYKNIPIQEKAYNLFLQRYQDFFAANALKGMRVGVYSHSSVAADLMIKILQNLGAEIFEFGKESIFYAMDTEALSEKDITIAKTYSEKHQLDVIVSTDGDGDRALMTDESGNWIHGDIIGMLCALILCAEYVVVPLSCTSSIDRIAQIKEVMRTRIGSPYVIEKMNELIAQGKNNVLGFESNGGVLIGTPFHENGKTLEPLPTRDSMIPLLSILNYINQKKMKLSTLVEKYCHSYVFSHSIKHFAPELSKQLLVFLTQNHQVGKTSEFFNKLIKIGKIESLDGLKFTFEDNEIIYLRPSGNSNELRCYTESSSKDKSKKLNEFCLNKIQSWVDALP